MPTATPKLNRELPEDFASNVPRAVAIGASTGAPTLVEEVIVGLPADLPFPILVAQHMPPAFTESFATGMARKAALNVVHAEDGMPVLPGSVYIGQGHQHLSVIRGIGNRSIVRISPEPAELLYKPSADILFESVVKRYGSDSLAVVFSGIGHDGVDGAASIVKAGGRVLTQSSKTCVVYGMPRACDEKGLSTASLDPAEIRKALLAFSPTFGGAQRGSAAACELR